MSSLGISEFTFGFAFLHEQVIKRWDNLTAAPILPSLRQEHDLGWDAHLPVRGTPFYYQFKLSDYMSRGNSKHITDGTYAQPYYRFWLHRNDANRQHRLLRAHSMLNPDTYYVAPELNAYENFENAFLSQQLTERSRLIKVASCDDIYDAGQHYITFTQGDPDWRQFSKSKLHDSGSVQGRDLGDLYRNAMTVGKRNVDRSLFEDIYKNARDIVTSSIEKESIVEKARVAPLIETDALQNDAPTLVRSTIDLLSAVFGLTLVVVGENA